MGNVKSVAVKNTLSGTKNQRNVRNVRMELLKRMMMGL